MKLEAQVLHEMTLELAIVVCLIDPGGENHVVEVHRALDRKVTESPYLVCQLWMFDDQQLIMGLPKTMFEGLWCMQNSTVTAKRRMVYTGLDPLIK